MLLVGFYLSADVIEAWNFCPSLMGTCIRYDPHSVNSEFTVAFHVYCPTYCSMSQLCGLITWLVRFYNCEKSMYQSAISTFLVYRLATRDLGNFHSFPLFTFSTTIGTCIFFISTHCLMAPNHRVPTLQKICLPHFSRYKFLRLPT